MSKTSFVDAAQVIGDHLGGISADDVQSVFGTALRYRLNDRTLRGEFTNIVDRYTDVIGDGAQDKSSTSNNPCALVAEYFNNRFVSGKSCYRSFRIRNTGNTTWASTGAKPCNLSYFLYDLDDPATPIEGCRSALPIPLRPLHELTIPLLIATPVKLGRYKIVVKLVQEFVGWLDQPIFEGEIEVVSNPENRAGLVNNPHQVFLILKKICSNAEKLSDALSACFERLAWEPSHMCWKLHAGMIRRRCGIIRRAHGSSHVMWLFLKSNSGITIPERGQKSIEHKLRFVSVSSGRRI